MLSRDFIRQLIYGDCAVDRILSGMSVREAVLLDDVDVDEMSVKLGGNDYSKNGYCCVLAGGSGSGKGFIQNRKILADFKVLDTDYLKKLYLIAKREGLIDDNSDYNLTNAEDVSKLHSKVKDLGWDKKREKWFFDYCATHSGLPNVLFDITGDDSNKLKRLGEMAKSVGYKVVLVWVVTPRQVAIIQNLSRPRRVNQKVFHNIHNNVISSVFSFLDGMADSYSQAFIVFNPGKCPAELSDEVQAIADKYDVIELEKDGNSFKVPDDIAADIIKFLGAADDPDAPQVYKDFDEIDPKQGPSSVFRN